MTTYVEELIWGNNSWTTIQGLSTVAPFPDPIVTTPDPEPDPSVTARRALRDDGLVVDASGKPTGAKDPLDPTLPLKYTLDESGWGLLPGYTSAQLTVVTGDKTYSDQSATVKVIDGIWFKGNVSITGKNYYFRNCLFNGNSNTASGAIITAAAATVSGNVIEDSEIVKGPLSSPNGSIGFWGNNITLRRVKIWGVEDGIRPYGPSGPIANTNMLIVGSFIGDLLFKSPDSVWGGTQSDHMTHNDLIQMSGGGGGITVLHSRLQGSITTLGGDALVQNSGSTGGSGHTGGNPNYTGGAATDTNMLAPGAVLMLSPYSVGLTGPVRFEDCEIGYAHSWINPNASYTTLANLTMTNNRWIRKGRDLNFAGNWSSLKTTAHMSGNRWLTTRDGHNAGDLYNG